MIRDGLLRHPRAHQGHGPQRRARVDVLPELRAVLWAALLPLEGPRCRPDLLRAYNDWHIEEWCGTYPGRRSRCRSPDLGPPAHGRRGAPRRREGLPRGDVLRIPYELGWPHIFGDHWDPFFQACEDEGTIICLHIGSSSTILESRRARRSTHDHADAAQHDDSATDLIWSPVLRRFPNLKFALSEGGPAGSRSGSSDRLRVPAAPVLDPPGLRRPAAERGGPRSTSRSATSATAAGVEARDRIGVDNITWECDYPHSDSTWPHLRRRS